LHLDCDESDFDDLIAITLHSQPLCVDDGDLKNNGTQCYRNMLHRCRILPSEIQYTFDILPLVDGAKINAATRGNTGTEP
jgi:hypothetical protein